MPRILSAERVIEYSVEFKIKVVRLTNELDVKAVDIANILNLHPMMIYRWRQEYSPSRRISMTKDSKPKNHEKDDEIKRLKKELAQVKKENDFLKKWERYLADQKKSDSSS